MKKFKIEILYGLIIAVAFFVWIMIEYVLGFHGKFASLHPVISLLFFFVPIALITYAVQKKKAQEYDGQMNFKQGFKSGVIITLVSFPLIVFSVAAYLLWIDPGFLAFMNEQMVNTADARGLSVLQASEQANRYFTIPRYLIVTLIASLAGGLLISVGVGASMRTKKEIAKKEKKKKFPKIKQGSHYIVGIAVKTSSVDNRERTDIPELWKKFFSDKIQESIPHKVSDNFYALYTKYEEDKRNYTYLVGCEVISLQNVPENLVGVEIPAGEYNIFDSTGGVPNCIWESWEMIRKDVSDRKYDVDFELYPADFKGTPEEVVQIHVGVD